MAREFKKLETKWHDCKQVHIIALENGEFIGSIMLDYDIFKDEVHLFNLFVKEEFRKRGIATALMDRAILNIIDKEYKSIYLTWCSEDSEGWALDWYKKLGFIILRNSEDRGLILVKHI